jgi:fructosamine-3-kinase
VTWAAFYATQRMAPLARLARDGGALPADAVAGLERLDEARLREVGGPPEPPARLHGDLWAGNRLVGRDGRSWLIDPAAHGGHREFDLAMMRLFGGFGAASFTAYDEVHPLAEGWPDRVALHQIAPLVVHAIKFGGGYVGAAAAAIARYA